MFLETAPKLPRQMQPRRFWTSRSPTMIVFRMPIANRLGQTLFTTVACSCHGHTLLRRLSVPREHISLLIFLRTLKFMALKRTFSKPVNLGSCPNAGADEWSIAIGTERNEENTRLSRKPASKNHPPRSWGSLHCDQPRLPCSFSPSLPLRQ